MDTLDARPRLHNLRVHPDLIGETRVDEVRASLSRKSPSWRTAQSDPFALTAGTRADDLPF